MKVRRIFITLFGSGLQFCVDADDRQQSELRGLLSLVRDAQPDAEEDWKGGDKIPRLVCLHDVCGTEVWLNVRAIQSVVFGKETDPAPLQPEKL